MESHSGSSVVVCDHVALSTPLIAANDCPSLVISLARRSESPKEASRSISVSSGVDSLTVIINTPSFAANEDQVEWTDSAASAWKRHARCRSPAA